MLSRAFKPPLIWLVSPFCRRPVQGIQLEMSYCWLRHQTRDRSCFIPFSQHHKALTDLKPLGLPGRRTNPQMLTSIFNTLTAPGGACKLPAPPDEKPAGVTTGEPVEAAPPFLGKSIPMSRSLWSPADITAHSLLTLTDSSFQTLDQSFSLGITSGLC